MSRIAKARAELNRLFGDVPVQSVPDRWASLITTAQTGKRFLPVAKARVEIRGDIACVQLVGITDGFPSVLLLDRKFWERTLSKIQGGLLHFEDGRVYLRYPNYPNQGTRTIDQWLANLVCAVREDFFSVRAKDAETVIDYRRSNLEVRTTEGQRAHRLEIAEEDRRNSAAKIPVFSIGGHRVNQIFDANHVSDSHATYIADQARPTAPPGYGPEEEGNDPYGRTEEIRKSGNW